MTRVVCVGPTLFDAKPSLFDGLHVQPPAERGDLLRLALGGASGILLIDGLYGDRPSTSHKEILFALSLGIPVLGAASLGALRAAECAAFGMAGVGAIYEDYASGHRQSDADVAVTHAPHGLGWRPLSVSMVDIDATLDKNAAGFSLDSLQRLRKAAQSLHFSKRTWANITRASGLPDTAGPRLATTQVHLKRQDALLALEVLRQGLPPPPAIDFEPTLTFLADVALYAPEHLQRFNAEAGRSTRTALLQN